MWFYLFGRNDKYPDPVREIDALAMQHQRGEDVFLKLSARDDAPLKNAREGESVFLCTRHNGHWSIHGEAEVIGPASRGETPPSMVPLYGPIDDRHWWRKLGDVRLYDPPKSAGDFGFADDDLPPTGQAHVIRVSSRRNGTPVGLGEDETRGPLDRLTAAMDAAWDEGRLKPEAIAAAVRKSRAGHRYGR